jgi:hypothetical protein
MPIVGRNMKIRAEVQYHDFAGTVAADSSVGDNSGGLAGLAKLVGIDTEKYMPLYATMYVGEGRQVKPPEAKPVFVTVGCVPIAEMDSNETWEDHFRRSGDDRPKVYARHGKISVADAFDFHRLSIAVYRRGLDVSREYEEIDLPDSDQD